MAGDSDELLLQINGLIDELDSAINIADPDTDAPRWLSYIRDRLKTIEDDCRNTCPKN